MAGVLRHSCYTVRCLNLLVIDHARTVALSMSYNKHYCQEPYCYGLATARGQKPVGAAHVIIGRPPTCVGASKWVGTAVPSTPQHWSLSQAI